MRTGTKHTKQQVFTGFIVVSLIVMLVLTGCSGKNARGRVLLIGVDGATLRIAAPLMEDGKLPNLAAIAQEGVSGPLRSTLPLLSPRIWNSIATGKSPSKHGITSFSRKDKEGTPHLFLSTDRKAHALWNIASEAGLTVGVVNWWNTYPPERVRGVIVSDHLLALEIEGRRRITRSASVPRGAVIFPDSWHDRLAGLVENHRPFTSTSDPFTANNKLPKWIKRARSRLSRHFENDGALVRVALEIEAEIKPDLLMVFLPGIDRISHRLWGNLEPEHLYPPGLRPSDSEREGGAAALKKYYEYTDELIGALMSRYGPSDLVMVVSDHGFEAGVSMMLLTGVHESEQAIDGIIFARGTGIPRGAASGPVTIYDVTPTILSWLRLPIAEDMDGSPAGFLQLPPTTTIATYGTAPIERTSVAPSGAEKAIVDQLRGLGYVE